MRRVAALLILLAACGSPTGTGAPILSFTGQVVFGIPTLATRAEYQDGGIKVTGVLQTPTADYTLSGTLSVIGSRQLSLEIDADKTRSGAPPFPVQNYYEGRIRNLAPGDYDLEVIHTLHTAQVQSAQVFRQNVRVP